MTILRVWAMAAALACMANAAEAARWDSLKNDGCVGWGKRQYSSRLLDTRGDWGTECRNTPVTIKGQTYRGSQTRCDNHGLGGMWGVWKVDDASCAARWDTPKDDGCIEDGRRQWSAILRDIPAGHKWEDACRRTPITINGVVRGVPMRCDNHGPGGMWGVWKLADNSCRAHWDTPKKDDCVARGVRQYSAILREIRGDWKAACHGADIVINGENHGRPLRCDDHGIGGMWGIWNIADGTCKGARWDTPKKDYCTGANERQWSAILRDIPRGQSWEIACRETPATVAGHRFETPARCSNEGIGGMWGEFSVPDPSCTRDERSAGDKQRDATLESNAALDAVHALNSRRSGDAVLEFLQQILESPQVRAEAFDTAAFMAGGSGGFVVGYEHAEGVAMTRDTSGRLRCYQAWSNSFTAGVQAGVFGGGAVVLSRGLINGFRGESNGVVGSAAYGAGYSSGLHWTVNNKEAAPDVVSYGLGGGGVGGSVAYSHTWTGAGEEHACATTATPVRLPPR